VEDVNFILSPIGYCILVVECSSEQLLYIESAYKQDNKVKRRKRKLIKANIVRRRIHPMPQDKGVCRAEHLIQVGLAISSLHPLPWPSRVFPLGPQMNPLPDVYKAVIIFIVVIFLYMLASKL
jgi:hypothetical protein